MLQHIPGRTENAVKNHWNATLRKRLLPESRQLGDTTALRTYMRTLDIDDAALARRAAARAVVSSRFCHPVHAVPTPPPPPRAQARGGRRRPTFCPSVAI